MSWLAAHAQDLLALATLAAAAGYLGRRWYRAAKHYSYGSSCGACPSNPETQAKARTGAGTNVVALNDLRRSARSS